MPGTTRRPRRIAKVVAILLLSIVTPVLLVGVYLTLISLTYDRSDFHARKGRLTEIAETNVRTGNTFRASYLTLSSSSGLIVRTGMLTPAAPRDRVPAFILLGGKATGKEAIQYVFDMRGVIVVALDYPYEPRPSYTVSTFLSDVPDVRRALLDMPSAIMLVNDYLHSRDDVDTTNVVIVGYSFGAPFVPVSCALDLRLDLAVMVYGGGELGSLIYHNVRRWEGPAFSRLVGWVGGVVLRPIEPIRYVGEIAPRPFIMINGTDDEQIPRTNTDLLYAEARDPKRLRWIESGHVHPRNVELTKRIIIALKEELMRFGMAADSTE